MTNGLQQKMSIFAKCRKRKQGYRATTRARIRYPQAQTPRPNTGQIKRLPVKKRKRLFADSE